MQIIGKDGKEYKTIDEALKADEAFEEARLKAEAEEKEKKNAVSRRKKELSDAIQDASSKVTEAEDAYKEAKEKASAIVKAANDKATELLKAVIKDVDKARESRMNAIKAFNDEFGAYEVRYTGNKAVEEYNKFVRDMNKAFNNFWQDFTFLF